jgi:hypothetical protein
MSKESKHIPFPIQLEEVDLTGIDVKNIIPWRTRGKKIMFKFMTLFTDKCALTKTKDESVCNDSQ